MTSYDIEVNSKLTKYNHRVGKSDLGVDQCPEQVVDLVRKASIHQHADLARSLAVQVQAGHQDMLNPAVREIHLAHEPQ